MGLEGAGIVRRVGKGAEAYKVGDRVAVLRNGTFANRIQVAVERTHLIPDELSFEVYMTDYVESGSGLTDQYSGSRDNSSCLLDSDVLVVQHS